MNKKTWPFNKLTVIILVMCMLLYAPQAVKAEYFSDTGSSWAGPVIEKWAQYDILSGFGDGTVRPNEPITVAQLATVINKIMKYKVTERIGFADVQRDSWYYEPLTALKGKGILNEDYNMANPDKILSREEAVMILAKAFKVYTNISTPSFYDAAEISPEARMYVAAMQNYGYIVGSDGYFLPRESFTRAHIFTVLDAIVKNYIHEPRNYSKLEYGNALVNVADASLKRTTVAGDLYIAPGVGDGNFSLDSVQVKGRTIIQGGGPSSIEILNSKLEGDLIIDNEASEVRIVSDSQTEFNGSVVIYTDAILNGDFGNVNVEVDNTTVYVYGNVESLYVSAGNCKIIVGNDGSIEAVYADPGAQGTEISGEGTVGKINVFANNVTIRIRDVVIELQVGVSGTVVGNVTVEGGATYTVNSGATGIVRENAGVSGDTDNTGSGTSYVSVSGVRLIESAVSLAAGESRWLYAQVMPDNANNRNVIWTTSNENVVVVSNNGYMTAVAPGTAVIRVITSEGAFSDICTVTVYPNPVPPVYVPITGIMVSSVQIATGGAIGYVTANVIPADTTQSREVEWYWNDEMVPAGTLLEKLGDKIKITSGFVTSDTELEVRARSIANPAIWGVGLVSIIERELYQVSGTVTSDTGEPVRGARVALYNLEIESEYAGYTDNSGNYAINVISGVYDGEVTAYGYEPGSIELFTVFDDPVSGKDVWLTKAPAPDYVITFENPVNGMLSAIADGRAISSGDMVEDGKTVVFTVTPDSGYQVKKWLVNDIVMGSVNTGNVFNYTVNGSAARVAVELERIITKSEIDAARFAGKTYVIAETSGVGETFVMSSIPTDLDAESDWSIISVSDNQYLEIDTGATRS